MFCLFNQPIRSFTFPFFIVSLRAGYLCSDVCLPSTHPPSPRPPPPPIPFVPSVSLSLSPSPSHSPSPQKAAPYTCIPLYQFVLRLHTLPGVHLSIPASWVHCQALNVLEHCPGSNDEMETVTSLLFPSGNGVHKGGCLCPYLHKVYTNDLSAGCHLHNGTYVKWRFCRT